MILAGFSVITEQIFMFMNSSILLVVLPLNLAVDLVPE